MKVVCNTSPIIFLSKLQRVDLLSECFGDVHIPQAVKFELGGVTLPAAIKIQPISEFGSQFVEGALGRLHKGELEAMILAREIQADYVLLDDLLARRKAQRLGLPTIGTVGVIVLAHRQKRITGKTAIAWLDELVHCHGLYLSRDIFDKVKAAIAAYNGP
jgi:predicted nucleic acid-binding protein